MARSCPSQALVVGEVAVAIVEEFPFLVGDLRSLGSSSRNSYPQADLRREPPRPGPARRSSSEISGRSDDDFRKFVQSLSDPSDTVR